MMTMRNLSTMILTAAMLAGLPMDADAQRLTDAESKSVRLSSEWQDRSDVIRVGADGMVTFMYGISQPSVVCAPLRLCDLQLQANERVINVNAGDAVQWGFDGARSGPGGAIPHILIKLKLPQVKDVIESSLIITTDLRVYHINLKAHPTEYMARMNFDYSNEPNSVVEQLAASAPAALPTQVADAPESAYELAGTPVESLDFRYKITGRASWKPRRVYNDGLKTIIEMPAEMRQTEAPALLVINESGKEAIVNYRVRRGRYIVDSVFEEAILIAGVGRRQTKVRIKRQAPANTDFAGGN